MLTEQRVELPQIRLSYASGPENGPPLAFFHGVTRRWQSFLPVLPELMTRWQLHAWDARGHGLSDRADDYRVTAYVEDACGFIREKFSGPGVVYGHSLGAMVALAVAAELPQLVRAVILEDPPFQTMGSRITETPLLSFFEGLRPFAGHQRPIHEVAKELAEIRITIPGKNQTARLGDTRDATSLRFTARSLAELAPAVLDPIVKSEWLFGYDQLSLARRVRCPVLLLQADPACGGMLTDADTEELMAALTDCTRIRFVNAPHLIHWAQTELLLRHVVGFLESL